MALAPASRIGQYEIVSPLGAGGMGEVYRAHDTKLGREVALKILPEAFASDPDRLMRFEREARTLASLNHPTIAQVYGIEDSPSTGSGQTATRALVMELVEGEDLSARIKRGANPLDEALPLARQIAEALEAGGGDVWMLDLADNVQRRFTFEGAQENASPVWSPDGRRLVYRLRRGAKWALVEKPADGAGEETTLAEFPVQQSAAEERQSSIAPLLLIMNHPALRPQQ